MKTNLETVVAFTLATGFLLSIIWLGLALPSPEVEDSETKTFYLGQKIYERKSEVFFFHGIDYRRDDIDLNHIVIGHKTDHYFSGGSSNIFLRAKIGLEFRLIDRTFKVISYGYDWIELEESK